MYQIICRDGTVLYDSSYPDNYLASEPHLTLEIGQPGNLSFSLLPEHPAYSLVKGMETYLSVYRDGEELFYGRVISIQTSRVTGMKQIECAGAISFLDDGELPPLSKDGETMTAQQFFTRCINAYNSDIGTDAKRNMSVGTVSFSRKSKSAFYQINSYTKVKNAIESYVTNKYGGFLRFRRANDTQYIDWIGTTEQVDPSPITLTQNVVDQDNDISANDFVTRIRPVGKDNLTLPEGTIEVQSGLASRYGRIIKTVNFSGAETESALRSEAQEYINIMPKGLGGNSDIKCIDMHYMDGSQPYIGLGVTYTNIAGFEGENMCVSNLELNLANPTEDTVVLKNERKLNTTSYQSTNKPAAGKNGGGRGGGGGGASGLFQNTWEHISETEKTLTFHADLISSHGIRIEETAQEFERYAQTNDAAMERIHGTGVFQNSDLITQVAGTYSISYYQVPAAKVEGQNPKRHGWYEFDPAGIIAAEDMKDSGIELFSSVDYQNPGTNGKITATRVNSSDIIAGNRYYQFTKTTDETPGSGKKYYSRGVIVQSGSEFIQDEDGEEHNIWSEVKDAAGNTQRVLNSALWIKKDNIVGAVGDCEITTDPQTGKKTLHIKSGSGLKLEEGGSEFGVYTEGNLTGGVIATIVNGYSSTHIKGDKIVIGELDDEDLDSWASDAKNGSGIFARYLTVRALTAREITAMFANIGDADIGELVATNVFADYIKSDGSVHAAQFVVDGSGETTLNLVDASVSSDGQTLTITRLSGSPITFRKAAPQVVLTGAWSGNSTSGFRYEVSNNITSSTSSTTITRSVAENWTSAHKKQITISATNKPNDARLWQWDVDASSVYTDGAASVGVVADTESHTVHVKVNESTKSVPISAGATIEYVEASHKYKAVGTASAGSSQLASSSAVFSGTEAYQAGLGSVTIASITGTSGTDTTGKVTATASNGKQGSENIYLTGTGNGGWNSGAKTIDCRVGSASGTRIARGTASLPTVNNSNWSWTKITGSGSATVKFSICGNTYTRVVQF